MVFQYGMCRCCSTKGTHNDLTKDYYDNQTREVYINIFIECFNIYLSTHTTLSTLICSACIRKLKEAASFREMVLTTERRLLDSLIVQDNETIFVNVHDEQAGTDDTVKTETKEECDIDGNGCMSVTQDGSELNEAFEDYVEGEAALISRFPTSILRALPTRAALQSICPAYDTHLEKLQDKIITAKNIQQQLKRINVQKKPPRSKLLQSKEELSHIRQRQIASFDKFALVTNACALLENSNATAFKTKMRSGYPCFYCRQIYLNLETLQRHQAIHSKTELFKLLSKYTAQKLIVYADVTDLKCLLCQNNIENINNLKSHLQIVHKIKMYTNYTDRVIPFKLREKDFKCEFCGFNFETFGAIERHMNTHYRNYVCEKCGSGFITKQRMTLHNYLVHAQSDFNCNICSKTFKSRIKYKIHTDIVHKKIKYYKCSKCTDTFSAYFARQKHLVECHNIEPVIYRCNICDRGFHRRYTLFCHTKRCHLEQRDYKCDSCNYSCFNKTELKEHYLKHTGDKIYQCNVCKKTFSRKRTLVSHMRVHNNDRFVCGVCGQGFVHKCSLKGHLRSQHGQCVENVRSYSGG